MKKVHFLLALVIPLTFQSCTSSPNATLSSTSEGSENAANLATNRKMYEAIQAGNMDTIHSILASDVVDHQGPNGGTVKGADSVSRMLADLHNHIKDMKFDIVAAASNGDYILTMVHMTGTAMDNTWGMTAGTKMDNNSVDVVKMRDGKMVEHWAFFDPNDMMKQMHQMPGKEAGKTE